jgi:hypothetical protein
MKLDKMPVFPNIQPGYLRSIISQDPPQKAESLDQVLKGIPQKLKIRHRGKNISLSHTMAKS